MAGPHDRPEALFEFAYIYRWEDQLADLAALAEPEDWEYHRISAPRPRPVLSNYVRYTYVRVAEESKIAITTDDALACFNTGLVTPAQESIFILFDKNTNPDQ
jgi:Domain of unknown function (DUF3825)